MTWNIGLALAIIIVLFPLALFDVLGLAGVVLVHELAEVLVILNGIRAARRPTGARLQTLSPTATPTPVDTPESTLAKQQTLAPPRVSMLNCYITMEVMK